ncbi:hypothetical protein NtRootA9_11110 [Arthrobacter sp. NtRootA9]|nr:hypothetical protein NtRootA9_11110 [Arthrobacter sp. NtRootA9]
MRLPGVCRTRGEQDLRGEAVPHKAVANLGGPGEIVGLHKYGSHVAPLGSIVGWNPAEDAEAFHHHDTVARITLGGLRTLRKGGKVMDTTFGAATPPAVPNLPRGQR